MGAQDDDAPSARAHHVHDSHAHDSHATTDRRRSTGIAMLAIGLALVLVGVLLLAGDDDGDDDAAPAGVATTDSAPTPSTNPPTTAPTTSLATTTTIAATTTTAEPAETLEAFVPLLAAALSNQDVDELLERLHPAVLEQYDEATCREALAALNEGVDLELVAVGETGPWSWPVPDGAVEIEDATTATVARTIGGERVEAESHFALVDGTWRWFTYCGPPPTPGSTP